MTLKMTQVISIQCIGKIHTVYSEYVKCSDTEFEFKFELSFISYHDSESVASIESANNPVIL